MLAFNPSYFVVIDGIGGHMKRGINVFVHHVYNDGTVHLAHKTCLFSIKMIASIQSLVLNQLVGVHVRAAKSEHKTI